MTRTSSFRVVNGRIFFKCLSCQAKRMLTVNNEVRRRSVRCHRCGEITHCHFNRRQIPREEQSGKATLLFGDRNDTIEVDLADISLYGIGFDVAIKDLKKIGVGMEFQLRSSWNPRLLGLGRFIVRSVKNRRVGAQRMRLA